MMLGLAPRSHFFTHLMACFNLIVWFVPLYSMTCSVTILAWL
jgi:hypothetical protein